MADDLSRAVGQLEGRFDALEDMLKEQNANRQAMHADNVTRFNRIEDKATQTYGTTMGNARWIEEKGEPLIEAVNKLGVRVQTIEDKRKLTAAETRGGGKAWAQMIGIASAIGAALGGVVAYGRDAIEFMRSLHHG